MLHIPLQDGRDLRTLRAPRAKLENWYPPSESKQLISKDLYLLNRFVKLHLKPDKMCFKEVLEAVLAAIAISR
jgi:hypothetical protein